MSQFRFKQFTIEQNHAAMKVGFDGILLGAWTDVRNCGRILDVGTGTGLVALMLAQRTGKSAGTQPASPPSAMIDAVEIAPEAVLEAKRNVRNSPWANRIRIIENSMQVFARDVDDRYDLIVSNPPWFASNVAPRSSRDMARQCQSLPMHQLFADASGMLQPSGRISLVLPHAISTRVLDLALEHDLHLWRRLYVQPTPDKPAHRVLLELGGSQTDTVITESLTIERSRHDYTPEFRELAKEFYLKF